MSFDKLLDDWELFCRELSPVPYNLRLFSFHSSQVSEGSVIRCFPPLVLGGWRGGARAGGFELGCLREGARAQSADFDLEEGKPELEMESGEGGASIITIS